MCIVRHRLWGPSLSNRLVWKFSIKLEYIFCVFGSKYAFIDSAVGTNPRYTHKRLTKEGLQGIETVCHSMEGNRIAE